MKVKIFVEGFHTSVELDEPYDPDNVEQVNDIIDQIIEHINATGLDFYKEE